LLHRHVRQIGRKGACKLLLLPHQLPTLAHALPHLRSLNTAVDLRPIGENVTPLPPVHLQHLSAASEVSPVDKERVAALLAPIGALRQLHALQLQLYDDGISLAPLQQLPLLRDLELDMPFERITERCAAELRALHWLHRLHIHAEFVTHCAAILHALLRDAPEEELRTLQWRDFDINGLRFTDELTPLLLRLPSLERLQSNFLQCARFDFLAALPRLTYLDLRLWGVIADALSHLLGVFISDGLTSLHTLHLHGGPCSSDALVQLLSHTPVLTSLVLHELDGVSSMSFFLQLPHLFHTLTQLKVECTYSWYFTAADLPPLHALQQLRELRLINWPAQWLYRLTAKDRAPFEQRPCHVLPQLELFEWTTSTFWA
jgi:hypothetical protein